MWYDDISEGDEVLFGFGGFIGLVIFIGICLYACNSESRAIKSGFDATIQEIGTCKDADCVIRVQKSDGSVLERATGSKVFVGTTVRCNESRCYKE